VSRDPRAHLSEAARQFYARGWMVGTAGNLSARLDDGSFWITVSGRPKGTLGPGDFIRLAPDGTVLDRAHDDDRPSAEAGIHALLYARWPDVRACYHVHSIEGNLAARLAGPDAEGLPLPPLEMLKGLGRWEADPKVSVAVVPNHPVVADIVRAIDARFAQGPPEVPGLVIRDHGVTVWGRSLDEAQAHLEIFEYLFRYIVAAHAAGL
jgi:methylthioribulose-1-phosphate dehydratase